MLFTKSLLKRNDKLIKSFLVDAKGRIDCTKKLFMVYPDRYTLKGLAAIDNDVTVIGIVLVMDENYNYGVFSLMNILTVSPETVEAITIDDKPYTILEFTAPNFISDNVVIKDPGHVFALFEEFYTKQNIPFYIEYEDLFKMFTKSAYTTGSSLGLSPVGIGLLTSATGKDASGKKSIRTSFPRDKITLDNFRWVSLSNADLAYDNNVSRLLGSYLNKGVTAALADNDAEYTTIEDTLRL